MDIPTNYQHAKNIGQIPWLCFLTSTVRFTILVHIKQVGADIIALTILLPAGIAPHTFGRGPKRFGLAYYLGRTQWHP